MLKVNNNYIKESNKMEERNEAVGLKVKDPRELKEEVETQVEEEVTPEVPEEEVDPIPVPVEPGPVLPEQEEEPEPIPVPVEPGPVIPEEVVEPEVVDNEPEEKKDDGFRKIACARLFNATGTTLFRFDIFYKEYAENSGTIEYRNIVDNFEAARPKKPAEQKEFFAMFGIIRWNFPVTVVPVNVNVLEALLKIESLINEQILNAGIKKGHFEFRVDTVDEH